MPDVTRVPNNQIKAHIGGGSNYISFKGETYSKDLGNAIKRQLVYQSTKNVLLPVAESLTIGSYDNDYKYLISWDLKQDGTGPFWNLFVNYSNENPYNITVNIGETAPSTPNIHTCNIVMKSMPLQTLNNYRYIWNHTLIYLDTYVAGTTTSYPKPAQNTVIGLSAANQNDFINNSNGHLKWIKEPNEIPTEPVYQTQTVNGEEVEVPHYWKIAYESTKPGVDYYQMPTYEITQSTRSKAIPSWWRTDKQPGKRYDPTEKFSIAGGDWLCLGGQIRYDGKAYEASVSYQWTPGEWDPDLYGPDH